MSEVLGCCLKGKAVIIQEGKINTQGMEIVKVAGD